MRLPPCVVDSVNHERQDDGGGDATGPPGLLNEGQESQGDRRSHSKETESEEKCGEKGWRGMALGPPRPGGARRRLCGSIVDTL